MHYYEFGRWPKKGGGEAEEIFLREHFDKHHTILVCLSALSARSHPSCGTLWQWSRACARHFQSVCICCVVLAAAGSDAV